MRKSLLSASLLVGLFISSVSASPTLAAPEWHIEMTHANAYAQQAGECPGAQAKYVPGDPEEDCGVDPLTGSGTSFDRGSGDNEYTITVKNTAPQTASSSVVPGETLSCTSGRWEEHPTSFAYRWLRNGAPIAGDESDEYEVTAADEGAALQCQVTASNAGSARTAASAAISVAPTPATAPPVLTSHPEATDEGGGPVGVGGTLTCASGGWAGNPTFAYRWLRNGAPIAGAESDEYEVTVADESTAIECQVTATNVGGSVVGENLYPIVVAPEPTPYPPYTEYNPGPTIPAPLPPNETRGTVSVADSLPSGLVLAGPSGPETWVSGSGWACSAPTTAAFTCRRSDGLSPGASYPPITAFVHVESEASQSLTNAVTVAGGSATTAVTAYDPTSIAAIPFGIDTLTTSVTNEVGNPFTQAGGHPFAASNIFVLNYVPGNEVGELITAGGGTVKDAQAELPPGFIGDPQNAERCTTPANLIACPAGSVVGYVSVAGNSAAIIGGRAQPFHDAAAGRVWNLAPQPGHAAEFGFFLAESVQVPFILDAKLRSDGDYGITIGDEYTGRNGPAPLAVSLTLCSNGVTGVDPNFSCANTPQTGFRGPILTAPTKCAGTAPVTTMRVDSWEDPADYVSKMVYNGTNLVDGAPGLSESFVTGCNLLQFAPEVELKPSAGAEGGTSELDQPTGAQFDLKVPQAKEEAEVNATPALKDATVTLPEGMTANPAAADGLEACSNAQFGLGSTVEPAEPAHCPLASQIGTVEVCTPLLENQSGEAHGGEEVTKQCEEGKAAPILQGQVLIGEPECSPCSGTDAERGRLFRLFLQVRAPERGVIVKLAGKVSANPLTGRLQATFAEQPQLPFGELRLKLKGGPRAPLANPQTCGAATTTTDLTPWSAPGLGGLSGNEPIAGTPDATPSSTFTVDWNGAGGSCPGMLPFSPSFSAGAASASAGASSPLSVQFGRQDREQDLSGVTVSTPGGLLGKVSEVSQCGEAQANAGTCPAASQIGTATVAVGAGTEPYYLTGNVYLTGPYKGDPFGLSVAVPAEAGPFKLAGNSGNGLEVVRAAIAVNPSTAALTVTSDQLPQIVDGVPLRLRTVHIEVNRSGFIVSPTSCTQQSIGATLTGSQGTTASVSSPFGPTGCTALPFHPALAASTAAATSKSDGASLNVTVASSPGEANIGKVDLTLPKALPSRLSTLQKACTEAQFNVNPAGCPEGSDIGTASAHTPLLNSPLVGPVYLVSHGGAAFPDAEFVLQGENGLEIVIDAQTQIRNGITYSRFETIPDAPISSFETVLPQGPHSIFGANEDLCTARSLSLGVTFTGQNGAQTVHSVPIKVTGCSAIKVVKKAKPLTRAQKLKKALAACRKKYKAKSKEAKRLACEKQARKKYVVNTNAKGKKHAGGKKHG